MVERCDYYSDDEYQQAKQAEEDFRVESEAEEAYRQRYAENEYRAQIADGISLDRLKEMCNAEKDGRLDIRPCKVGDTLWINLEGEVIKVKITKYGEPHFRIERENEFCYGWIELSDIGKTVFFTRPEAEEALRKEGKKE